MYHKLARGHATAYISGLRGMDTLEDWFKGPRCMRALRIFEESCRSKKPGRVARRLGPLMRPAFPTPRVGLWTRDMKVVVGHAEGAALESEVFALAEGEEPLYRERSVFQSNVFLTEIDGLARAEMLTVANISHHAITRMLEREVSPPEDLPNMVGRILSHAQNMAMAYAHTDLDTDKPHAFLMPFRGGALPVVTMYVRAGTQKKDRRRPIMSVRTYLGSDMLNASDHERMGGFERAQDDILESGGNGALVRWLEVNSRPWTILSGSSEAALKETLEIGE